LIILERNESVKLNNETNLRVRPIKNNVATNQRKVYDITESIGESEE
jgi:hypothetical protein